MDVGYVRLYVLDVTNVFWHGDVLLSLVLLEIQDHKNERHMIENGLPPLKSAL